MIARLEARLELVLMLIASFIHVHFSRPTTQARLSKR